MAGSEAGEKCHSPRVIGFPLCDKLKKNGLKSPRGGSLSVTSCLGAIPYFNVSVQRQRVNGVF